MSGPASDDPVTVTILISGKVQGVFFRSNLRSVAERNAVVGWVRNLQSGEVEALIQGKVGDVDRVLEWCNRGPDAAKVTKVSVKPIKSEETYRNFSIIY